MRKPYLCRPAWAASLVFAAALVSTAAPGWAWIDTGHKVVALVAWEDLTPATRSAVTEALKQHPRYAQDLLSGGTMEAQPADANAGLTADDLARKAFAASAVWPDLVKAQGHPMRVRFSHSNWHYIDIPFTVGAATQPAGGAAAEAKPDTAGPHDVVSALTACVAELRDPATAPAQRAVDLCWVTHLVGDVHQPLHCAMLVSDRFPKGDTGGNDQVVLRDARFTNTRANLHLIWDSLPGEFASDDLDRYEALGLRADPRYARAALDAAAAPADYMAWAMASHRIAVDDVYLNGKLNTATAVPGSRGMRTDKPAPGLPPGYLPHAEHIAMKQVALAGYRLADLLNSIYDGKGGAAKP